jgi:hypothetical protein
MKSNVIREVGCQLIPIKLLQGRFQLLLLIINQGTKALEGKGDID